MGAMNITEARSKFIESWGKMASDWGINRTMAQVHALLLIAPEPLTADGVMEELDISRGNTNMNLRALMDWGLVHKQLRSGERKEYFFAEKDMWTVVRQIIINRKRRELDPMLKVLDEAAGVEQLTLDGSMRRLGGGRVLTPRVDHPAGQPAGVDHAAARVGRAGDDIGCR